ncbi:MAG: chlororespiratory reduction protein 7 [Microcystaceae cyanobacterium]
MPDSIMYQGDSFVLLETDKAEELLTPEEMLEKLLKILPSQLDSLPKDVQKFTSLVEKATYVRDNYCELDMGEGKYLEWYVVRLEKK